MWDVKLGLPDCRVRALTPPPGLFRLRHLLLHKVVQAEKTR